MSESGINVHRLIIMNILNQVDVITDVIVNSKKNRPY